MPDSGSILIVGAGPTGLMAAVELARQGRVPRVIETRNGASNLSRAVGILPRTIKVLARTGTDAPILAEAITLTGATFHRGARPVAQLPFNSAPDGEHLTCLAQDRTEHHLIATFSRLGGTVDYGHTLEDLKIDGTSASVTINGAEQTYDLVIGCDGVHSATRAALGLAYAGYELPQDWSIADVYSDDWPAHTTFEGFLLDDGNVAIVVPLESNRFRVISSTPDALSALPVPMTVTKVRRSGTFNISVRQVPNYNVGPVFLAGDAAHSHSPVGGRGMNLGMADAADLAERIINGTTEGYHAARHAAGARTIRVTERARRFLMSDNTFTKGVVNTALAVVSRIPILRRALVQRLLADDL